MCIAASRALVYYPRRIHTTPTSVHTGSPLLHTHRYHHRRVFPPTHERHHERSSPTHEQQNQCSTMSTHQRKTTQNNSPPSHLAFAQARPASAERNTHHGRTRKSDHDGTRTHNPLLRSQMRYPLRHAVTKQCQPPPL